MFDIILEITRALVLLAILAFLLRVDKDIEHGRKGWLYIKFGFLLILFGAFVDITDNFDSLNWVIVLGNTPIQAFLEKVVGYLGGFIFIAIGFWLWIPSIQAAGKAKQQLNQCTTSVDQQVHNRTAQLSAEIERRRKTEMALRQAEERHKLLYDNAPAGIVHSIVGGSMLEFNDEFAHILGYETAEDLTIFGNEQGNYDFFWRDQMNLKTLTELMRKEDRTHGIETRLNHKDGSPIWVQLDNVVLRDRNGVQFYFYCFVTDINERKLNSQRVAESEQRLKALMESMPLGIYLVDTSTQTISDINPSALTMTGYTQKELIGQPSCDKFCLKSKAFCAGLDPEGVSLLSGEVYITRKDGTEFPAIKTVAKTKILGKEYLLETFVDISEQKRIEQLKEDVDRIVRHDLKSPVIGVINASTVALMEESIQGEAREMLEIIKNKGNQILSMIGMSMAIYKMESGTFEYKPEALDFMDTVRHVLADQQEPLRNSNVSVLSRLNKQPITETSSLPMKGSSLLFQSLMANLLTNAIEASTMGQTVELDIHQEEEVTISISNHGVVPAAIRDNFFGKYITSGKSTGTGLGTYSAELITRTVGGSIAMQTSDEKNKTTITIKLPSKAT